MKLVIFLIGLVAGGAFGLIMFTLCAASSRQSEFERQEWVNGNLRKALFKACELLADEETEIYKVEYSEHGREVKRVVMTKDQWFKHLVEGSEEHDQSN